MLGIVRPRRIRTYITEGNKIPFEEWFGHLKDKKAIKIIETRLERLNFGHFGDYKTMGGGLFELRINYGPGYRIYFGQGKDYIILLLCGGDKNTQQRDIKKAHQYWADYRSQCAY